MTHSLKKLDKSQVELTITVTPPEYAKQLESAAVRLSERAAIKGFRAGHVPYEIMKREVGEMAILEAALERIIQESFFNAITEEKLDTIGMPQIKVEKLAPGNDVVYTALVALLPGIKLPDLATIHIEKKAKEITDKEIDEVIENLKKMQAKEVIKNGPAGETDKIVIDLNMLHDNVPVEGGQSLGYGVYLSEPHYIPGFDKQLIGLKKGDEKEFELSFPDTHYQKHLAGKTVLSKVAVKDVFERQFPEVNDEFAKSLGQENLGALKELLKKNLGEEEGRKAEERAEIEMLDTVIAASSFEPIPDVLIDAERKKMFYELTRDLERNSISIEQYLKDIKKKEEDIYNDFKEQAEKRAKAALLSRQIAKENNITVNDADVDAEIAIMEGAYKDNPEYMEQLKRPEVQNTIRTMVQNKKVIAWLKERIVK